MIGSGAGGAVTALELAQKGIAVTVLEEGAAYDSDYGKGSPQALAKLYRRRGMTPIVGSVPLGYAEGATLGGSTEVNSGFWHRTPRELLLRWHSQFGLGDASYEELVPHFEWAEALLGVGLHRAPLPRTSELFARGAEAMGWAAQEIPRTSGGCGKLLFPAALAAGARVLTRARAEQLLFERGRCTGVLAELEREPGVHELVRVDARHVIVCAGPTETPALLRRSGVKFHVGETLRVHPMLKVAARFPDALNAGDSVLPLLQVKEFWPELSLGGAFFTPGHLAMLLGENWGENQELMRRTEQLAAYYVAVRGEGRGWVRPSVIGDGATLIRYELGPTDLQNLSRGLARLASLLFAAGATEVYPAVRGMPPIRTEAEAIRWLDEPLPRSRLALTTVHAFSSCPMGERSDHSAADSFGKLRRREALYVNDASMLPDSPGVNPQGSVMALARRNVLHFLDRLR